MAGATGWSTLGTKRNNEETLVCVFYCQLDSLSWQEAASWLLTKRSWPSKTTSARSYSAVLQKQRRLDSKIFSTGGWYLLSAPTWMFRKKMAKLSLQFSSTVFNRCHLTSLASFRFKDEDENEDQVQLLLIVRMLKSVTVMAWQCCCNQLRRPGLVEDEKVWRFPCGENRVLRPRLRPRPRI